MATLADQLTTPEMRPKVVRACQDLVDAEVASKSGFSGAAIKTAYRVVKALKPGVVSELLDKLLPDFIDALDPLYQRSSAVATEGGRPAGETFETYLVEHDEETTEALLSVTDARAENAKNKTLKKTYQRLRGSAHDNVKSAVPSLARTLAPFL